MSAGLPRRRQYLVLSDVHLGARRTTAKEILDHLTAFFHDFTAQSPFIHLDVIFIAGDLWDDSLTFADDVLAIFFPWWRRFLMWCSRHDVAVVLLEGTPRHDRRQNATVAAITKTWDDIQVDFRYITELCLDYVAALDMHVLFVPDEIRHSAEIVERDAQRLLDEHGLKKADIAIMHGMFDFQLGTIPTNAKVYSEAWWLDHVKNYISIGHIHSHSQYGRIIAQGSFDRLKHKEEEPKGAMWFQESADGEWVPIFVENTLAKVYKTVRLTATALDKALRELDKAVKTLPPRSHVLIEAQPSHPIFESYDTLKQQYYDLTFTQKKITEEIVVERVASPEDRYIPIVLNKETLTDALMAEVANQHVLDVQQTHLLRQQLEDLK